MAEVRAPRCVPILLINCLSKDPPDSDVGFKQKNLHGHLTSVRSSRLDDPVRRNANRRPEQPAKYLDKKAAQSSQLDTA